MPCVRELARYGVITPHQADVAIGVPRAAAFASRADKTAARPAACRARSLEPYAARHRAAARGGQAHGSPRVIAIDVATPAAVGAAASRFGLRLG